MELSLHPFHGLVFVFHEKMLDLNFGRDLLLEIQKFLKPFLLLGDYDQFFEAVKIFFTIF
jgi:hypothetical protein